MVDVALAERHVREFARACVRSGLLTDESLREEVAQAISGELPSVPDPRALAESWVAASLAELQADQAGWPDVTDHDRLRAAFADLESVGVVVLQGVEDHWVAKDALDERAATGSVPRGIAWFTPPDVWHAVDEGMLEVNLWHGSTANAAPGDALLDDVLSVLAGHGLAAHFDEGRIEVAAHWQRRVDLP